MPVLSSNLFYGCSRLEKVIVPEGVKAISGGTFGNCPKLLEIELPNSLISADSWNWTKSVVIKGSAGSYAEQYAKENGIVFHEKEQNLSGIK